MKKNISLLGSTGSIGTQALEVIDTLPGARVLALAAHRNTELLSEQIKKYKPELAVVFDEEKAALLKKQSPPCDILSGPDGLLAAARISGADMVINALVGGIGLSPTLAAIEAGIPVGLANKETLVTGGHLVMDAAKNRNVPVIPIDSEHSAIFQCLNGGNPKNIHRIILTASGGPFYGHTKEQLKNVTATDALNHPTWKMGRKVTIDSATLMNKGFEVIEAFWLFGVPVDKIDVVIHRQSVIHSMIEFTDGSIIAQMGAPDMRVPISYALTYPERAPSAFSRLDFSQIQKLTFGAPDTDTFPCLTLAYDALKAGGRLPAALNDADEEAVRLFLDNKIGFLDIPVYIKEKMDAARI